MKNKLNFKISRHDAKIQSLCMLGVANNEFDFFKVNFLLGQSPILASVIIAAANRSNENKSLAIDTLPSALHLMSFTKIKKILNSNFQYLIVDYKVVSNISSFIAAAECVRGLAGLMNLRSSKAFFVTLASCLFLYGIEGASYSEMSLNDIFISNDFSIFKESSKVASILGIPYSLCECLANIGEVNSQDNPDVYALAAYMALWKIWMTSTQVSSSEVLSRFPTSQALVLGVDMQDVMAL